MSAAVESFTTTRHRCSCCRRSWASKTRAKDHVTECLFDTDNQACPTCTYDHRGHPAGYDEPAESPYCEIGARSEDEVFVTHCERWRKKSYL